MWAVLVLMLEALCSLAIPEGICMPWYCIIVLTGSDHLDCLRRSYV